MTIEQIKETNKYQQASVLLLQENKEFKQEFLNFAPSISSEIESASVNLNCSCKGKIIDYIQDNADSYLSFLYNFLITKNLLVDFIEHMNSIVIYKNYSGKVAKTKISEWQNFATSLAEDNASFKTFSILREGEDVLVFFL
jgi:hypothetical protein